MASFVPRAAFPPQLSLPRSYFLGHHASGLAKMKTMLSHIDLIIECRDYRLPLASRNPLFEQAFIGRERLIIYTKKDLGTAHSQEDRAREKLIRTWQEPNSVIYSSHSNAKDMKHILNITKDYAYKKNSLLGYKIMIVGMPNVGKSTLLNALRTAGVGGAKAASTGAQPGITRKIASSVKIVDKDAEAGTEGVYLVDTPGVFVPYVPDEETMLKLALVGSVKDTIIPPTTLADYLLYQINKHTTAKEDIYGTYCPPTNDIIELLEAVCFKNGKLLKGGLPDVEAAALWIVQRFRQGNLGKFVLDDVSEEELEKQRNTVTPLSLSQARKRNKDERRQRAKSRVEAAA